jgi:hypothetical protein
MVGALITGAKMIGTPGVTPVRALINEAAALIPAERLALCLVVASGSRYAACGCIWNSGGCVGVCAGISAETHVT